MSVQFKYVIIYDEYFKYHLLKDALCNNSFTTHLKSHLPKDALCISVLPHIYNIIYGKLNKILRHSLHV